MRQERGGFVETIFYLEVWDCHALAQFDLVDSFGSYVLKGFMRGSLTLSKMERSVP